MTENVRMKQGIKVRIVSFNQVMKSFMSWKSAPWFLNK